MPPTRAGQPAHRPGRDPAQWAGSQHRLVPARQAASPGETA